MNGRGVYGNCYRPPGLGGHGTDCSIECRRAASAYQITYDGKVIFPAAIAAGGTATYTIQTGTPEAFDVKACGRCYPERMDDMAWENDLVAFRAYGPALQAKGERGFGYDLFTKYNTTEPMLEAMYAKELDKETLARLPN